MPDPALNDRLPLHRRRRGNRLTQVANGTSTTYTYNAANELTGAGGTTYTYDANGNHTGSSAGLVLSYNTGNQNSSRHATGRIGDPDDLLWQRTDDAHLGRSNDLPLRPARPRLRDDRGGEHVLRIGARRGPRPAGTNASRMPEHWSNPHQPRHLLPCRLNMSAEFAVREGVGVGCGFVFLIRLLLSPWPTPNLIVRVCPGFG